MSVVEAYKHEFALSQTGRALRSEQREKEQQATIAGLRRELMKWRIIAAGIAVVYTVAVVVLVSA